MNGYNDLKRELKKIWDMPVKIIPRKNTKEIKAVVE